MLTFSVDNNVCTAEKKISINFTKANTKCFLSLHYNGYESYLYVNNNGYENYLFVNKTETCKFKALDNIPWYQFCLGCMSKDFIKHMSDISLGWT